MGKKIVDEDMHLNIIINGDEGKKELYELEERVRDLSSENDKLGRSLEKYDKQISKNEATMVRYTRTLDKQAEREEKQLKICDKAKDKYHELSDAYKKLSRSARETPYGRKIASDMAKATRAAIESSNAVMDAREQQTHLQKNIKKLSDDTEKLKQKRDADTASLNNNKAAVSEASAKIGALRKNLDVTTLSLDELNKEIAITNAKFRQTDPNDPKWKEYQATLVRLRTRHQELSAQAMQTKGVLCRMAEGINKYWSFILGGFYSVTRVFNVIDKAVAKFVGFDDILSDTRKTTDLTKQEVQELNASLKQIDTRTAQEELQSLARIGGKLGIKGRDNLEGFVRAADQINVALKEDLGGDTEEAIRQVGKLVDIFGVKEEFGIEQGLLKVGSAINELGASSTANEEYIVEFSKRVAGVAPSAGVSVDAVMGLAATLDQLGQHAEASSTVYAQMMAKMFKNTAAYANIAGMGVSEFSRLMNTDANEAFIRVLEGLKGNNEGMEALVRNLGDMQLNGVRATTILGTLANNTDKLREQQNLANKSFREGISLTDEFNIKNTNAAALADKQKKIREDLIRDLGEKLQPIIVSGNNQMNRGLKILNALTGFLVKHGATLVKTTALIAAYTIGIKAGTLANKLHLTSIAGVIANLKRLYATMSLNPWGMISVAVAAIGYGTYKVLTSLTDTEKAIRRVTDASKEFEKSAVSEQITIDRLFGKLKAAAEGTREWDTARKAITDKYGQYLKELGIELNSLKDIEGAYKAVSVAVRQAAKDRALEKASTVAGDQYAAVEVEQLTKIRDAILKKFGDYEGTSLFEQLQKEILSGKDLSEDMQKLIDGFNRVVSSGNSSFAVSGSTFVNDVNLAVRQIRSARTVFEKEIQEIESVFNTASPEVPVSGLTHKGGDTGKTENNPGKDKVTETPVPDYDAQIIALKQSYAAREITKEKYEKQLDALELAHLQHRLETFNGKEEDKLKLQKQLADKQVAIRDKQYKEEDSKSAGYIEALLAGNNSLVQKEELAHTERLRKAGIYGKDRKILTAKELAASEMLEKQHQGNLQKIEEDARKKRNADYLKGINDRMKNAETADKIELTQLRIRHNEELAAVSGNASERKKIQKKHAEEILELTARQADEMVDLINDIMMGVDMTELDLGDKILSEEQKQELIQRLLEIQAQASGIKLEQADSKNSGTSGKNKQSDVDILGMSPDQWEEFYEHLASGKLGIEDLQDAVGALSSAWSTFDKLRTAQEKKQLKQYEQNSKKKKNALDKQLESGAISQEQYTARTAQLDADLDAKKEELEKKQAGRAKRMAIFETVMNTAVAIVGALKTQPPWLGIALAAIVGAMGAVQLATIMSAQYARGKYPVVGRDDGRTYQADYAGDNLRTGIYQQPTLGLFSEKEPEMVVDGATTRKLVFDYPQIYQSIMDVSHGRTPQFAGGNYPAASSRNSGEYNTTSTSDPEIKQLLQKNIEMMQALRDKKIEIPWYGRGGIDEKMSKAKKYERQTTIKP